MKITLIGLGSVGSVTLQHLLIKDLGEIFVVNRDSNKARGIILDTVSAFPDLHEKIHLGTLRDMESSDIVLVTAGPTALPNQSFAELSLSSFRMIKNLFAGIKLRKDTVVIITTTPVDEVAEYFQMTTNHPREQVLGLGGSLDESRLRYLVAKETGNATQELDVDFVGIHGGRGIPIIRLEVSNVDAIKDATKNYFKSVASLTGESTVFGPAKKLADLVQIVTSDKEVVVGVSAWDNTYEMYVTHPFLVSRKGVVRKQVISMSEIEQRELESLLNQDKDRRKKLFMEA